MMGEQLMQLSAQVLTAEAPTADGRRRLTVQVAPYGVPIVFEGQRVQFDGPDALDMSAGPVLQVGHGDGVLERIGRLERHRDTAAGKEATFVLADTAAAREAYALARDGIASEVSVGLAYDPWSERPGADGIFHRRGVVEHVAMVGHGAFGKRATVLAVHDVRGGAMPPDDDKAAEGQTPDATDDKDKAPTALQTAERPQHPAPESAPTELSGEQYEARLRRELAQLRRDTDQLMAASTGAPPARTRRPGDPSLKDVVLAIMKAQKGDVGAQRMLAALSPDTTTTGAGIVPDFYAQEVIGLIAARRPFLSVVDQDPIGDHGMSVIYPKVVTAPTVAAQAAELDEVENTPMDIDPVSIDLATIAGASQVSIQLIERSQPSFVERLFKEYARQYAKVTDASALAAASAAAVTAGNTAVLADFGADAAATWAAIVAGAVSVMAGVEEAPRYMWVSTTRWGQLLSLVDTEGRPLLVTGDSGPTNAQGAGGLNTLTGRYGGLTIIADPHATAAGTAVIGWEGAVANLEAGPQELRALQVSLLAYEMGVYGYQATAVKYPDGLYSITAA